MKKIEFMDTSFRDGIQSFFGARVMPKDLLPAISAAVDAGITHFETAGGAHFQSMSLYCKTSAFDAMDEVRKAVGPNVTLQSLARGINVVALSAQPRDMISLHAKLFKKHGVNNVRNFDALNDIQNLEYSAKAIKEAGLKHQVVVTIMDLPPGCVGAHDVPFYMDRLKKILDSGIPFDSIAFKDSTGTSSVKKVYELVKAARKLVGENVVLWMHSHATAGIGEMQYQAAIEAGINGIDIARRPLSGGTSQPDLLSMWHALKGSQYSLDIDYKKVLKANQIFEESLSDYFFPPEALSISPEVIFSPMPGGALTANTMMMRDTKTFHLYHQVIEAMGEVIKKGGFGTSVTPVSQFYFQQAYANVTLGAWKKITEGYGKVVLGYYGKTPSPPDLEIIKLAKDQLKLEPFSGNPLDNLKPYTDEATNILKKEKLLVTDENIFTLGAFDTPAGNKGLDFLKGKLGVSVRKKDKEAASQSKKGASAYQVSVDGQNYQVTVDDSSGSYNVKVDGSAVSVIVGNTSAVAKEVKGPSEKNSESKQQVSSSAKPEVAATGKTVNAGLPGKVLRIDVKEGSVVKRGDVLMILEAMKMENGVASEVNGEVSKVLVKVGDVVKEGTPLIAMK